MQIPEFFLIPHNKRYASIGSLLRNISLKRNIFEIQRHCLCSSRSWKYLKKNGEEGGNFQKVYYFPHQFVSLVVDDQSAQSVSIHVSMLDFK